MYPVVGRFPAPVQTVCSPTRTLTPVITYASITNLSHRIVQQDSFLIPPSASVINQLMSLFVVRNLFICGKYKGGDGF